MMAKANWSAAGANPFEIRNPKTRTGRRRRYSRISTFGFLLAAWARRRSGSALGLRISDFGCSTVLLRSRGSASFRGFGVAALLSLPRMSSHLPGNSWNPHPRGRQERHPFWLALFVFVTAIISDVKPAPLENKTAAAPPLIARLILPLPQTRLRAKLFRATWSNDLDRHD